MIRRVDERSFGYQSYMVRISPSRSSQGWRATLYHAQSGARHSFVSLEALFAFIAESVERLGEGAWHSEGHGSSGVESNETRNRSGV